MTIPQFNAIKREITVSKRPTGHSWQIQSDNDVVVVDVTYNGNAGSNKAAVLSNANKSKNNYSFKIDPTITREEFSKTAQDIIAHSLVPVLMIDAIVKKNTEIVIYPEVGQEGNVEWMLQAMKQSAEECDITVEATDLEVAEKKTVPAILLRVNPDESVTAMTGILFGGRPGVA